MQTNDQSAIIVKLVMKHWMIVALKLYSEAAIGGVL